MFNDGFCLDKIDPAAVLKSICSTHSDIFSYVLMLWCSVVPEFVFLERIYAIGISKKKNMGEK